MDESNIKEPGPFTSVPPAADPKVEPDLPALRQGLQVRKNHNAWLSVVALLYPAVSFPLLLLSISGGISFCGYFLLATIALAMLLVAAVLYLWVVEVLSNGWAVAAFTAWMLGAVFVQLRAAPSLP